MGANSSTSKTNTSTSTSTTQSNSSSYSGKTLSGVGNLIKLLPTGTVFMFQFLNPVVTNGGHCNTLNKYLSAILLVVCASNCCFASFTDSYTGSDGNRHYGVVTTKGIWPSTASDGVDLSKYKLRFGDFVHAFLALIVFAVLALMDTNTVRCFYPGFESAEKILIQVVPPAIGVVSGALFMIFPNTRHGIGYPVSDDSTNTSQTS
ncbi:hypothetical protein L6164_012635 [Bauhinia variegata]|uniref:Uncharacterized protein n=1 Tax=Bauhinia variegata TaxID=167791 RepID=A0ACB9P9V6_BAUVA|nr:hypothetical protein L6164_012635 [Bauhinia variegata]